MAILRAKITTETMLRCLQRKLATTPA